MLKTLPLFENSKKYTIFSVTKKTYFYMSQEANIFLSLEGNVNDLLTVSNTGEMKCTRLIDIASDSNEEDEEVIDVCITSTNAYGHLPRFDSLLNKKIRVTIEVLD